MSHSTRHDRRRFLQGLTALLATGTAGALFPQLELMGRALAAAPAPGEYRALVCIFLFGGNDSFNMLIPHEASEYALYQQSRGGIYDANSNPFGLGIARDSLSVAGVDILRSNHGPLVMEVNSSPGLEGIEVTTGKDVASMIIQYIEKNGGPHLTRTKGKG